MILNKPYTNQQYADFAHAANQNGQRLEQDENAVFALYPYEILENGQITDISQTPEYIAEQEQKEAERIAQLSLTKREFLLALYSKKGITPDEIKAHLAGNVQAQIEFEYAERFYRGNPLFDGIGAVFGVTPAELDNIFLNNAS